MAALVDALLEEFPWPDKAGEGPGRMDYCMRFEFEQSPKRLWPILADTSRLNRALGLGPVRSKEQNGLVVASSGQGIATQTWEEDPWEWVHLRWISQIRHFTKGFAKTLRYLMVLRPNPKGGTEVLAYFGWYPRGVLGRGTLKLVMQQLRRRYMRVFQQMAEELKSQDFPAVMQALPDPLSEEARVRLKIGTSKVLAAGGDAELVALLVSHIEGADEHQLNRLRVLELARMWDVDERELLTTFLEATRCGLLEMRWEVICPHCRGARAQLASLGEIPERGDCQVCEIEFGTGGPDAIEVTFRIHSSIRKVEEVLYCTAGPARRDHVALQVYMDPKQSRQIEISLPIGPIRMRTALGTIDAVVCDKGLSHWDWPIDPSGVAEPLELAPECLLKLANLSEGRMRYTVEKMTWAGNALLPRDVFGNQKFRDLYSDAFLAANVQLAVGEQTILFTDVVDSTRFYEDRGDPFAFSSIKQHFVEMYQIVEQENGVVVKTIGDAIMAGFLEPCSAVRAAFAIQNHFRDGQTESPVRVRVSVHKGPCIAVNLNSGVDYFGRTVNRAAKLQANADAGQIALSEALVDEPGVGAVLAQALEIKDEQLSHKAFAVPIALKRIRVW